MKKLAYQTPAVKVTAFYTEQQIAAGSVTAPEQGIGYGGVDDGTHDPDSKDVIQTHSVWED
jgi:hypothetical protein